MIQKKKISQPVHQNDPNFIKDIYDGNIYKKFKSSINEYQNQNIYSFTINSDGISLCEKSKLSIWPIILVINELPKEERFFCDNVVLAGLYVGYTKPDMNQFFQHIYKEIKQLEYGIKINEQIYKFFPIIGIFDKPARAMILNILNSTGYNSCLKCYQPGRSVNYGHGSHLIFDYNESQSSNLRSHSNYLEYIQNIQNGVKGNSWLGQFEYYETINSTNIDIMHSVFLGVIKDLFSYWFSSNQNEKYSLKHKINEINQRISTIRPVQYIQQPPRSVEEYKNWRAHEFMNFMIFFSIPVFYKIMDDDYLDHLYLLIISLQHLLDKKIATDQLDNINSMLTKFVSQAGSLYDEHIYTSGMHELLHLVQCTLDFGPLYLSNLFPFEELNRYITSSIKGQYLVGDEFIKL